jgi:predicted XRE-type DNA-binding protein
MDNWKEVIKEAYAHAKKQGLTQTQIAEKIGCTQKKISTLVNGKYQPLMGFALKFIEACGLEIEVKEKQLLTAPYGAKNTQRNDTI